MPVSKVSLNYTEYALDALGMREDDLFIRRMFACTARAHPEKMSFQEFLTVCVVLMYEIDNICTRRRCKLSPPAL